MKSGFVKRTVSIPEELVGFVGERKEAPEFAGNLSAYVRGLILRDRESRLPRSARLSVKSRVPKSKS